MSNLKEVRDRIGSVDSTKQITSAMKMVAAAKLRKAQDAIERMRPYAEKLEELLGNLSQSLDTSENVYGRVSDPQNVLIVGISSNRGLCGGFNNNIIKKVQKEVKGYEKKKANVGVLGVGKKVDEAFYKTPQRIKGSGFPRDVNALFDDLTFENVAPVAENIMERFRLGHLDKVVLVYNQFRNAAVQIPKTEQFLPILPPESANKGEDEEKGPQTDFIFQPSKEEIVQDLIPRSLKIQFYKALLDSHAAEHGARMTAMHSATENAEELLEDLRLTYNKVRQAAITKELLEIVSGADALEESE